MTWAKGQSGNPAGRAKTSFRQLVAEISKKDKSEVVAEMLAMAKGRDGANIAIQAANWLLKAAGDIDLQERIEALEQRLAQGERT